LSDDRLVPERQGQPKRNINKQISEPRDVHYGCILESPKTILGTQPAQAGRWQPQQTNAAVRVDRFCQLNINFNKDATVRHRTVASALLLNPGPASDTDPPE
jgi:hypothetical protein